mmetsp:Transcript_16696/g.34313  ORF Transcript_16696/g.34313 Transcript_16696/m.34313 type:complete len:183 (-) Transcript_16696:2260-2808(-)
MESRASVDTLTRLQMALDDMAMKMYTYVGILQRDAPALDGAGGDGGVGNEADLAAAAGKRAELAKQAEEYATEIVRTHRTIRGLIEKVRSSIEDKEALEEELLSQGAQDSSSVGVELSVETSEVENLLARLRASLREIEVEEDAFVASRMNGVDISDNAKGEIFDGSNHHDVSGVEGNMSSE